MKVAVAIVLLSVCALAQSSGPGRLFNLIAAHGSGPAKCMSICKDDCEASRNARYTTCLKPCIDECGILDWSCKRACKKHIDCEVDVDDTPCLTCKNGEKFQTCIKPFKDCVIENCADQCPKPADPNAINFIMIKNEGCRDCAKEHCKKDSNSGLLAKFKKMIGAN